MKTRLVPIGGSLGIRIPKSLLERTGLSGEVEIRAVDNALVIRSPRKARTGWAAAFRAMAEHGDDRLVDESAQSPSEWDKTEWEWPSDASTCS